LFEKKVEILQIQTLQNKWLIFFVHTNLGWLTTDLQEN
jgi:hypothetical protein